jgi:SAM-dependent methyltransferase
MHPVVFKCFEALIERAFNGTSALEVGALPNSDSLLSMNCLRGARKVGVNLVETGTFEDFQVIKCNANDMSIFSDGSFDLVMSNATLEHDRYFWKSLAEMKRVCSKDGIIIIGVPGFTRQSGFIPRLNFLPDSVKYATPTFLLHHAPGVGDYYRFSEECVLEVFLEGLHETTTQVVLSPPRIIGMGYK